MYPKCLRLLGFSFIIILLFESSSGCKSDPGNCDAGEDGESSVGSGGNLVEIEKEYYFILSSYNLGRSYGVFPEQYNCTVNQTCTVDSDCYQCFPNWEMAFKYGIEDVPSLPFCPNETTPILPKGLCTCGIGKCVSYSTDRASGKRFFYCGPCGYVGASCANHSCTHPLSTCKDGFCECVENGIFYNMAYCYIPYFGAKVIIQMFISTLIIVSLCGVLAYSYHRLSSSRGRYLRRFNSWRRSSVVRESPPEDTPPTYDDVVEKVPSYQDALEMENIATQGNDNPAFVDDEEGLPPPYEESISHVINPSGNSSSVATLDAATDVASVATFDAATEVASLPEDSDQPGIHSPMEDSPVNSVASEEQPIGQPIRDALGEYRRGSRSGTH
ncbi:uncharacterized protein [Palaemon carinicauda]|uniref:uncharacterized protein n=1 Tax=Palaemon carinicauda TaxID=392227 RepID=UPI0035B5F1E4